jgi:hypothetical protein
MLTIEQLAHAQTAPILGAAVAAAILSDADSHRVNVTRLLTSAMMVGQMYSMDDQAQTIHTALAATMGAERGAELRITRAFASAMAGDAKPARALLAEDWDNSQRSELAQVVLALSLRIAGDPDWSQPARKVLSVSSDDAVRVFAKDVLGNQA